jgi:hypothetical protein
MNTELNSNNAVDGKALTPVTADNIAMENECLRIRRALRSLMECNYSLYSIWVHKVIAHVQGITLVEKHDDFYDDVTVTNIKPYLANGLAILLTMFAVDEDLDFIHRWHKFDPAGFRKTDSSELLKDVGDWNTNPDECGSFDLDECTSAGPNSHMTPARRKHVLELFTNTGLLERKPDINRTTLVIRLRGDRIIDVLKRISPRDYADLNY